MRDQLDKCPEGPCTEALPLGYRAGTARLDNDLKKMVEEKRYVGGEQGQCASDPYPHFRNLIDRLIDYHNRQSNNLHALLRALPQDMSRDAMQALYDLAKTQLTRIG